MALITPMARFREADGLLRKSEEFIKATVKLLETARLREAQHRDQRKWFWQRWMPAMLFGAVLLRVVLTFLGLYAISGS